MDDRGIEWTPPLPSRRSRAFICQRLSFLTEDGVICSNNTGQFSSSTYNTDFSNSEIPLTTSLTALNLAAPFFTHGRGTVQVLDAIEVWITCEGDHTFLQYKAESLPEVKNC